MGGGHGMGGGQGMGEMHDMMGGMGSMMGGGMAVGMLLWALVGLALLVLAVVATVWLVRRMGPESRGEQQHDGAEHVLRRRYAAGEIDDEEFHRRLAALSSRRS